MNDESDLEFVKTLNLLAASYMKAGHYLLADIYLEDAKERVIKEHNQDPLVYT